MDEVALKRGAGLRRAALLMLSTLLVLGGCGGGGGADAPPATVQIVAAGDIGQCGNSAATSAAARTAALVRPEDAAVLMLGDATYPVGAPSEFADCFQPTWGALKDRIRPVPGNHEYLTPDAAGYFDYFGAQAGPHRRGWYSYEVGRWHVIALNSNVDASPGSPQYQWLAADLAASAATRCTLAYWHYPVFSSGRHGNLPQMAAVFALLHGAGVEVVLVGHDHLYERFAPQDAQAVPDPVRGVRAFVVGTGGAALYPWGVVRANSEFRDNSTHGLLRLTLGEDRYAWQFVPVGGGPARDSGSASCHP